MLEMHNLDQDSNGTSNNTIWVYHSITSIDTATSSTARELKDLLSCVCGWGGGGVEGRLSPTVQR